MDKWESLVNCIHRRQVLLWTLAILLLVAIIASLVLHASPIDTDTYSLWCNLACGGEVGCVKGCLMDRPGWWR
jgi:hypothetical protein